MIEKFQTSVRSEIGELEAVILHTPGKEIENMNPENVERALYSDILNLTVASKEYSQMKGILDSVTKTFQVKDLLIDVLDNQKVKERLLKKICLNEHADSLFEELMLYNTFDLATLLIEGAPMKKNSLTSFLCKETYSLRPLHNFFFTRDASISMREKALIGNMKSNVRERESLIMEAIFDFSTYFTSRTINPANIADMNPDLTIEGGDILIAREDIICIGIGGRTNSMGVDFILEHIKKSKGDCHIIVQELPLKPESFIHLDMVFTFLDVDQCMVYEPLILKPNKYQTVYIQIEKGIVKTIQHVENMLSILRKLGMDLKPILCGGSDSTIQDREQWHSGANFFALAPGKVIGYERNIYTIEEMNKNGFDVLPALDVLSGKVQIADSKKCVITIEGSELSRGGGGCRCMTMPIRRKNVDWKVF